MSAPATDLASIPATVAALRHSFQSGRTRPLAWRQQQLDALLRLLNTSADELIGALQRDMGKPEVEAHVCDIAFTGVCVNHVMVHIGPPGLPFGGWATRATAPTTGGRASTRCRTSSPSTSAGCARTCRSSTRRTRRARRSS
jgi:acyl-CoA reductase-like NAD-dependent aldehyde dehydrogenase